MRAVIICAAPTENSAYIKNHINDGDYVICADGGIDYALQNSVKVDLAVGDFDSAASAVPDFTEKITLNPRKDDTDTLHCIDTALKRGFNEIVLLCALGGRLDHSLANIISLDYALQRGADSVKLIGEREEITVLPCGSYSFRGKRGRTFSLFAFNCEQCTVSYQGADYPLTDYTVKADVPLGISNVFTSDSACIEISDGKAVLIINYA